MSDKPIASPCNSICSLNDEDTCIGCFRTREEIREWSVLDDYQRLDVLVLCGERARKNNPFY
jgi:predicted Fe-S protein YdhL (DUF1289 family)